MPYIVFYFILFGISLFTMCLAMSYSFRQCNFYYPMLFVLMAISNGGYLALCFSTKLETAILAQKIYDIGGCFLMPIVLLCVLELCNFTVSFWTRMIMILISMGIYALELTVGRSDLYFESQYLVTAGGYTQLEYTVGPLYTLFPVQLLIYAVVIIAFILYTLRRSLSVSYRNVGVILQMVLFTIVIYFTRRLFHYDMNLIPLAYAIDGLFLLSLLRRLGMYDIHYTVANSRYTQDSVGYLLFDQNKVFLAKNDAAVTFYSVLAQTHVDYPLPNLVDEFARFNSWMNKVDDVTESVTFYEDVGDRNLKCTTGRVLLRKTGKKKLFGYLISISDVTDERKYSNLVEQYNEELKRDVELETHHVKAVQEKLILGMANMIENRDNSTGGHIKRTSKCIEIIANEIRNQEKNSVMSGIMTDRFCAALIKAAPLHDIGKIAVDDDILRKPGKFTPEEFEQMKQHAAKGSELLRSIMEDIEDEDFIRIADNMAHYHHERWNGTGYPCGLKGEEIPPEARIMALADVYDALVSKRCYKEKMSFDEATAIIRDGMGSQFDPALAAIFEACKPTLEAYYTEDE